MTASLLACRPAALPLKPALTFSLLALLFLLDLALATQGGIHIYHLMQVQQPGSSNTSALLDCTHCTMYCRPTCAGGPACWPAC